ncbi:hypothetical protein QFC20_007125 [Naganishia adeliensis]|uniref:Uncharacterized protein n=1 Tax=Naganishia adeliensis TaxID=92952 RepID=A0ACC2V282_9TREE|nr:hypothetical protein QFC20_007125 [Naganishia adeliensis]
MSTEHTSNTAIPADRAPPATAALDQVAQDPMANIPAGLQKFMNQAETYMNKAVETAKPYTAAVAHKTEEIIHQIQGQVNATTAQTAQATENLEQNAAATTEKAVQEGEKDAQAAKGFFEQGLGRVTATLTQVTNVIDQRTATDKHPGFATMLQQATHNMIEKVDHMMDASVENPATTSAAAAAVSPFTSASPYTARRTSTTPSTSTTSAPSTSAAPSASVSAPTETATSGPNTASTSSAPVVEGEKPVVTTTNSMVHSEDA